MSFESTRAAPWRNAYALVKGERVLTHNLIVGGGTIAAGVLGVAFQSLFSHQLRPVDYGGVFAVVTLITFIGLPASALTLLMARETSRDQAEGQYTRSAALLHSGNRVLLLGGLVLAAIFAAATPLLATFFRIPEGLLWAAAAGMPFGLALPLLLGELQGAQRFLAFASLSTGAAGLKLLAALVLGILLGPVGIIAGISLAMATVYLTASRMMRRKLSIRPSLPSWRPAGAYLAVIVPSTLALAVLLSTDVLLVKRFFPDQVAGEYSAVAALGRAIFWGATGVAGVLFPKIVFRESRGHSGSPLISASLILVALGGLFGLVVFSFGSKWILTAFAGSAYLNAARYLPWYAVGMTLLGGAAVLIMTQQSRGKPAFLAVLVPLTLLEPALLMAFHKNLMQVVQVVDICMGLLLVGLAAQLVLQRRTALVDADNFSRSNARTARDTAQVQVSR
jgi:O-antigen/teichoic acid export membrane protein